MRRLLAVIFAILLILPTASLAQDYLESLWDPKALAEWVFPGMAEEWLRVPEVFYYVIFPFFTAMVVIYGILMELRIFRRGSNKLHVAIAFCFAFLLLPSGILTYIVNIFYAFGAFIGLIGFGILFIVGVILWVYGTGFRMYGNFGGMAKEVSSIRGDLTGIARRKRKILEDIGKEVNDVVFDTDVRHAIHTSKPDNWPSKLKVGDKVPNSVKRLVSEYKSLSDKEMNLSSSMRKMGLEP
jgi:hypothetical protein